MTLSKGWIVSLLVLMVVSVGGLTCYGYANDLRNEGIQLETSLTAQYASNQNELSTYISTFYEQLGLANRKSAVMDTILTHAVQGRYGENGFSAKGAFFSAVQEAYPDLTSNLAVYDKIMDHVSSGRQAFKGKQDQLLDRVRNYKNWLDQGFVQHSIIQFFGFPSDRLEAKVGGKTLAAGRIALAQMENIIVTGSTVEAYTTGRQDPLSVTPKNEK
jgi:hypothetical protein